MCAAGVAGARDSIRDSVLASVLASILVSPLASIRASIRASAGAEEAAINETVEADGGSGIDRTGSGSGISSSRLCRKYAGIAALV